MATTFDLSVIFRMVDQLSDPMSKMSEKMKKFVTKTKDIGASLTGIGQKLTVGLTLPIIAAGTFMIKSASDINESINKVDVAFGNSSQMIKDWSLTTLKSFGIAQGTALDMAATFGDMGTSMGIPQKEAAKMSQLLVGLAGDLASFKNISIDQANTALASVYTGETESLKKLGIVMTQVNLQEFAYQSGIRQKIQDLSQSEQVMLRYNYVMSKTKNAQGDFARTSDGAANQSRIFGESLKEVSATFGALLLPIFTKAVTILNKFLSWLNNTTPRTKKFILELAAGLAILGPIILGLGITISTVGTMLAANPIGAIITGIALAIILLIIVIRNWKTIWEMVMKVFDKIPAPLQLILALLMPFLVIPILIIRNWKKIVAFFKTLQKTWGNMPRIIKILILALFPFINLPYQIIKNWKPISEFFVKAWKVISENAGKAFSGITRAAANIGTKIKAIWESSGLPDFFGMIWDGFLDGAKVVFDWIKSKLLGIFDEIKNNPVIKWLFESDNQKGTGLDKKLEGSKNQTEITLKVVGDGSAQTTVQGVKSNNKDTKTKVKNQNLGANNPYINPYAPKPGY